MIMSVWVVYLYLVNKEMRILLAVRDSRELNNSTDHDKYAEDF